MANFNWKTILRLIFMKIAGILLALVFLPIALLFVSYPAIALVTMHGGKDARVVKVSDHLKPKWQTGFRVGGLFMIATENTGGGKSAYSKSGLDENIYCLYPAWPDQLQPLKGDEIRVWPSKKPLVGAPVTEGWGWFLMGTVFVLGLVMLEFTFLALTLS